MMPANDKLPAIRTTNAGTRVLIIRASVFDALQIEDPLPEAERPATITKRQTQKITNLSRSSIDRMIRRGRETEAA